MNIIKTRTLLKAKIGRVYAALPEEKPNVNYKNNNSDNNHNKY